MIESNWQDSLFTQSAPELGNQYRDDPLLGSWLRRTLPAESLRELEPELDELGAVAGGPLYRLQLADRLNEPTLRQWDAWGNRVDELEVTPLWREAERLAVRHGLVATGYEPAHGRHARIAQFAKVYLFHPSSDVYTCPLAMTDGAARSLLESGNQALIDRALPHCHARRLRSPRTDHDQLTGECRDPTIKEGGVALARGPGGSHRSGRLYPQAQEEAVSQSVYGTGLWPGEYFYVFAPHHY